MTQQSPGQVASQITPTEECGGNAAIVQSLGNWPTADAACWKCKGSGRVKGKRGVWKPCIMCRAKEQANKEGPDADVLAERKAIHIVVVGGGIGGCAASIALRKLGYTVTLLEKDVSFAERKQGYGLTIQQGWGALRKLGLEPPKMETPSYSHFAFDIKGRILGYFGSAFSEWFAAKEDYSLKRKGKFNGEGRFNSHVPRQHLRYMLLHPLAGLGVNVEWDSRFEDVEAEPDTNLVKVTYTKAGTLESTKANLVVGADGIFSGVRRAIYGAENDKLNFLGCVVILGIAVVRHPLTHERVCETMDGETRLYTMPFTSAHDESFQTDPRLMGQDSIMWQLSFPVVSEDEANALCIDNETLKAEALRRCGAWHDPLPALLSGTDLDLLSGHPVYDRPELDPQDLEAHLMKAGLLGRVALVGDAAHPMSPFKGQGANQTLVDAASLAKVLVASRSENFIEATQKYHADMCSRTASKVKGSRAAVQLLHMPVPDPNALQDLWDAGITAQNHPEDLNEAVVALRGYGHHPHALHSIKIAAAK